MKTISQSLRIFLFFTLLAGVVYPLLITGFGQLLFPKQANGSILHRKGKPLGSELIGQSFDSSAIYFSSRPSYVFYNPLPSGGSNLALSSRKLKELFVQRDNNFRKENGLKLNDRIPSEMLFASGSGLDPHISPEAALLQVERICRSRSFTENQKLQLIKTINRLTEAPQYLFLGEKRINVLVLNLETDKIK